MALTKVNRGGLNTGVSDSSNATFLTVDSSEQAVIKSEGGAVTTSVQQGLGKHWVNINGTSTIATRDSFNLSSAVDNGTANYTFNLTNAHNNINYTLTCSGGQPGSGQPHVAIPFIVSDTDYPPTASAYRIGMLEPGTAWGDAKYVMGVTHGDLA